MPETFRTGKDLSQFDNRRLFHHGLIRSGDPLKNSKTLLPRLILMPKVGAIACWILSLGENFEKMKRTDRK